MKYHVANSGNFTSHCLFLLGSTAFLGCFQSSYSRFAWSSWKSDSFVQMFPSRLLADKESRLHLQNEFDLEEVLPEPAI